MINKIVSVVFIIIGTVISLFGILSFFTGGQPASDDPAYKFGYYSFPVIMLVAGGILLFVGIKTNKKYKKDKIEKDLIDSLPK